MWKDKYLVKSLPLRPQCAGDWFGTYWIILYYYVILSHYFPDNCKLLLRKIRGSHLYTDVNLINCGGARGSNYTSGTARTHSCSFTFLIQISGTLCALLYLLHIRGTLCARPIISNSSYILHEYIPYSSHISAISLLFKLDHVRAHSANCVNYKYICVARGWKVHYQNINPLSIK